MTAAETSTPNRHTLASSSVAAAAGGGSMQRTFIGGSNGTVGIDTHQSAVSSSSIQSRRYHSKSLSLSEGKTLSKAFETPSLRLCTFSGSSQLFQQNRSMWEKRTEPAGEATVTTSTTAAGVGAAGDRNSRNAAPDLVLDLPAANSASSSSSNSSSSLIADGQASSSLVEVGKDVVDSCSAGPASPTEPSEEGSGADCFAHNQYTLKKNDKFLLESSRHTFSADNNNSSGGGRREHPPQPQHSTSSSVLHISEEAERASSPAETQVVIAERNTHKFITQFADLKLTGGSLPVMKGAGVDAGATTATTTEIPIRPILRREKPQILRKPTVGLGSSSASASGPSSLMSFGGATRGKGLGGDSGEGATGAKSLE